MTLLIVGVSAIFIFTIACFINVSIERNKRRERYLTVISPVRGEGSRNEEVNKMLAKQRAELAKKLKHVSEENQEKKKGQSSISELMRQAGIEAPVSRYWLYSGVFALFVGVLLMLTSWPLSAKILLTFVALFGIPKWFLKRKAASRQKKFLKEFADALDAMGRLLQAGMPMTEAISMASREFTGPLKEEMLRVYENQRVGVSIGEAAFMMARRVPIPEVQMFATALQIQSETGSSLSEVLFNLSNVIRARFRLRRKVQALSSEAKSSAAIIGCLPLLVMLALWAVRPEYIGQLFRKPAGHWMLGGSAFWMSLGILMMRQMINFRI
jgi:tight adherence protein B